jgi:hypothetical protein
MILGLASWVWMRSLTRSIGAVVVLATAPETPPAKKLITKSLGMIINYFDTKNRKKGKECENF